MAKASKDLFVVERDLRLDLLRGLGLWMIFLDHIPDDVVSWMTLRNYGFSDAAEFFVFISGYLAGFIYGPIIASGQFLPALKQRFPGWTAYLLSGDARLPKLIGLKASRRTPLWNGALECRLYEYRLVAGSARDRAMLK